MRQLSVLFAAVSLVTLAACTPDSPPVASTTTTSSTTTSTTSTSTTTTTTTTPTNCNIPDSQGVPGLGVFIATEAELRSAATTGGRFCIDEGTIITLTSGELVVEAELVLASLGPNSIGSNVVIDAAGNSRVISISISGDLTLNSITVTGGFGVEDGAGIYNDGGALTTYTDTSIIDNTASRRGGGIYNDLGTIDLLDNTSLSDNTVDGSNTSNRDGGGIYNLSGTVTLGGLSGGATISDNDAVGSGPLLGRGGGIYNAGLPGGTVNLAGVTIEGNTATTFGGGIYNFRGPISFFNSTVVNNTVFDSGPVGGGVYNDIPGTMLGAGPPDIVDPANGNIFNNLPDNYVDLAL